MSLLLLLKPAQAATAAAPDSCNIATLSPLADTNLSMAELRDYSLTLAALPTNDIGSPSTTC